MELLILAGGIGGGLCALGLADRCADERSKPGVLWLLFLPLTALGIGAMWLVTTVIPEFIAAHLGR